MMSDIKILVLDDEYDRACGWRDEILTFMHADITVLPKKEVSDFITELHRSRLASRNGAYEYAKGYDQFDLLIVDYDLLGLDEEASAAWSTGAEIAYTARLMSRVGPIVVVNQYGTCNFDLTMKRTLSSYADYDVGSLQITSPGFWASSDFDGFRPWHWPNIVGEVGRIKTFREFIFDKLDLPVIQSLGFELADAESPRYLTYDIAGLLGVKSGGTSTFREIAINSVGLSVFNILDKDRPIVQCMPDEQLANVACAIVSHWLERVVLPGQQCVADMPHLASRYPWLLSAPQRPESWSALSTLNSADVLIENVSNHIAGEAFFYSRPAYWIQEIDQAFPVPEDFDISQVPDHVFCEDSSKFHPRSDSSSYPSDLIGFDNERWVVGELQCGGKDVSYEPQAYLLM
ncbi:hypothetical protein LT40_16085 [Pseudomonas rhizosphaerae]|uniref:Uncharacterized protein n=2 Tax=Pseudomonas rhizosphaerae TaxID=216142 RepID=A0A089ZR60_9PSED|nr:hypothetical protein LT40_16085 [Pseudomonas rhizosphaerae]